MSARGMARSRGGKQQKRQDIRCGKGGGFSAAACCFALVASCESEALRKRSIEKRRCLGVSSWMGGDSGLANTSDAEADEGRWPEEADMPSFGGVTGGAGTTTREGPDSWTAERAPEGVARPPADPGRECCEGVRELLLKLLEAAWSRCNPVVCFRMSDSLAITPRRRRNGMVGDHMWV